MVYECEKCREQLHPSGLFCHRCGHKFAAPVPEDAVPPSGKAGSVPDARRGRSPAARATIVLPRSPLRKSLAASLLRAFARSLGRRSL